jgi:hypothetical protein
MTSVRPRRVSDGSTKVALAGGVARFAGIMLGIVAVLQILEGLAAITNDSVFAQGLSYAYEFDITVWGWIHLSLGVIALGLSVGIITKHPFAYVGAILVAILGAIANFASLPYYPLWTLLLISFNFLVIWAMCAQLERDRGYEYYAGQDSGGRYARPSAPGTPPSMLR